MDFERCKNGEQTTHSVLQANQCFVNKILSRSSSDGRSSRFFHRIPVNVPFKWELRPGKPKDQPQDDDDHIVRPSLCPPGPPPVALSKHLSRPRVDSSRPIKWFWRKFIKKNLKSKKNWDNLDCPAGAWHWFWRAIVIYLREVLVNIA